MNQSVIKRLPVSSILATALLAILAFGIQAGIAQETKKRNESTDPYFDPSPRDALPRVIETGKNGKGWIKNTPHSKPVGTTANAFVPRVHSQQVGSIIREQLPAADRPVPKVLKNPHLTSQGQTNPLGQMPVIGAEAKGDIAQAPASIQLPSGLKPQSAPDSNYGLEPVYAANEIMIDQYETYPAQTSPVPNEQALVSGYPIEPDGNEIEGMHSAPNPHAPTINVEPDQVGSSINRYIPEDTRPPFAQSTTPKSGTQAVPVSPASSYPINNGFGTSFPKSNNQNTQLPKNQWPTDSQNDFPATLVPQTGTSQPNSPPPVPPSSSTSFSKPPAPTTSNSRPPSDTQPTSTYGQVVVSPTIVPQSTIPKQPITPPVQRNSFDPIRTMDGPLAKTTVLESTTAAQAPIQNKRIVNPVSKQPNSTSRLSPIDLDSSLRTEQPSSELPVIKNSQPDTSEKILNDSGARNDQWVNNQTYSQPIVSRPNVSQPNVSQPKQNLAPVYETPTNQFNTDNSNDFAPPTKRIPAINMAPSATQENDFQAANTGNSKIGQVTGYDSIEKGASRATPIPSTGSQFASSNQNVDVKPTTPASQFTTPTRAPLTTKRNVVLKPADNEEFEPGRVLALVGGDPIFVGDLMFDVNQLIERVAPTAPEAVKQQQRPLLIKRFLPKYIDNKLLYVSTVRGLPDEADVEQILGQADKEFDEKVLSDMMENSGVKSVAEFDAQLRAMGSSLRKMRRAWSKEQLTRFFLSQQLQVDTEITHQEMLDFYRDQEETFMVKARSKWEQVMVRFDKFPTRAAAKAAIVEMGNKIVYGAKLSAVAKDRSQGFLANEGGQHDWTSKGALVLKTIDKAIFELPVGQLSDIIESRDGFHIVRVVERREAGKTPFLEAQVDIKKKLSNDKREAAFQDHLAKLKKEIPVEIFEITP